MSPVPRTAPPALARVLILSAADDALRGGYDAESVVGVRSSVSAIARVLDALDVAHTHVAVHDADEITRAIRTHARGRALVFNLIESVAGRDEHEALACGLLELAGVAYTGAGALALGLCQQKPLAKLALRGLGLPTPAWCVLRASDARDERAVERLLHEVVGLPAIVKPAATDASSGIDAGSVVHDAAAVLARAAACWEKYGPEALVEAYVDGRELNVGIVGNDDRAEVLPIAEIEFDLPPGMPHIVTYDAKWVDGSAEWGGSRVACPARLSPEVATRVAHVALRAYRGLGCRDYGRVDLRLAADGTPFVLEVNPNPDLAPDAGLANAARVAGLTYDALVSRVLDAARARTTRGARVVPLDRARAPLRRLRGARKAAKARVVVSRP